MRGIDLTWAGGRHRFVLEIAHLRAIQQYCDAGPDWILHRLKTRQWRIDDVLQVLRFGLEGGGLSAREAQELVDLHVGTPITPHVLVAVAVLSSALYGLDEEGDDLPADQGSPSGE